MSGQTSKKAPNEMVQLAAVLLIITAITAGLLGLVNNITEPIIEQNNEESLQAALRALIPGAEFDVTEVTDDDIVSAVYAASTGGYCVKVSPGGFGGPIDMIVGIEADGTIAGTQILTMSETPGLGAKAADDAFAGQFIGAPASGSLAVSKDGGSIDSITGATITSRAVVDGINAASSYVGGLS